MWVAQVVILLNAVLWSALLLPVAMLWHSNEWGFLCVVVLSGAPIYIYVNSLGDLVDIHRGGVRDVRNKRIESAQDTVDHLSKGAFRSNPFIVILYWVPRGIWYVVSTSPNWVPKLARFMRTFGWNMFVQIHSRERVICLVDSAIGTVIGYMSGYALIGACAGAVLGIINYELVTKRWLIPRGYLPTGV